MTAAQEPYDELPRAVAKALRCTSPTKVPSLFTTGICKSDAMLRGMISSSEVSEETGVAAGSKNSDRLPAPAWTALRPCARVNTPR